MAAHSILPPSSADIWGRPGGCTAWVLMNQTYPEDEPTQDSLEGDAVHALGAQLAEAATRGGIGAPDIWKLEGEQAENGVIYTDEMLLAADLYADHVGGLMRSAGVFGGNNLGIERTIPIPTVHDLQFGTPDFFMFDMRKMTLYIRDLKFGYIRHDPYEHWQMIDYFAGVLCLLGIPDLTLTVDFGIIQPRAYHKNGPIQTWKAAAGDLRGHINTLHNNAHKALGPDAEAVSGPHCRYCPGRHACPAALLGGLQLYEAATGLMPQELPNAALGLQLTIIDRAIEQLKAIKISYRSQVEKKIRSGQTVPFWATESTPGKLEWNQPVADVLAMGDALGLKLKKPDSAVTPTQAKALAKKCHVDEAVIMAYSKRAKSTVKIVSTDEATTKRIFE